MIHTPSQRGFSLIETMVAITILVVAIIGPMTIAARGLQSAYHARDQITATLLAQEGIEIVREKRDSYAIFAARNPGTPDTWYNSALDAACKAVEGCGAHLRDATVVSCATADACRLKYDTDAVTTGRRGLYSYNTGIDSPFTRKIFVSMSGDVAAVTVRVSWSSSLFGGTREVVLKSYIYNHYEAY